MMTLKVNFKLLMMIVSILLNGYHQVCSESKKNTFISQTLMLRSISMSKSKTINKINFQKFILIIDSEIVVILGNVK